VPRLAGVHHRSVDDRPLALEGAQEGEATDLERIVAERDALRVQLEAHRHGLGWRRRARRSIAPLLVVVFALSTFASGVGTWLHRSTLDRDVWAERAVPLGEDPAVQAALAAWTTSQVVAVVDLRALLEEALPERADVLAGPMSSAVTDWIGGRVDRFFASDRFGQLWAVAVTRTHDRAVDVLRGDRRNVTVEGDQVTIDLIPVINAVLVDIAGRAPALVGGGEVELPRPSVDDAPEAVRRRIGQALGTDLGADFGTITVDHGGDLAATQQAVRMLDRLVVVSILVMVLSAAGALTVSTRRRRTVLQLLGATALVAIAVRRLTFVLQDQILDLVRVETNRPAASAVVHAFTGPFTDAAATTLWIVAALALLVAVTGPYPWASRVRRTVSGGQEPGADGLTGARREATSAWLVGHADALRLGGYAIGALALWVADLTWSTLLLLVAAVAAWQMALVRLTSDAPASPEEPSPAER
jgi:hypothetical protein